jgi:hypothetical protein
MDPKCNLILAGAIAAILGVHGAVKPDPCITITSKWTCPEPEPSLPDMNEREQQNPQTFYGAQSVVLGTATGPINLGIAAITEGANFVTGTGTTYQQPDVYPNLLMTTLAR